MVRNILLYGATGYSGGLLIPELIEWCETEPQSYRLVLGGRDAGALRRLAADYDVRYRAFSLDERRDVRAGLEDIDVVLNAAGPFAWTAERLAKVALEVGTHYVDINGEADVYNKLDDLGVHAMRREVVMVCGAGFWAAASDWLLHDALDALHGREIGAVRIAMSRISTVTRGSVETVWRSLREQVTVVRGGLIDDGRGGTRPMLVLWHEPVGKLERTFNFGTREEPRHRVASAASLVDTLIARQTLQKYCEAAAGQRPPRLPHTVESYVEAGFARRMLYQLGSMLTPVAALPLSRELVAQSLSLFSEGPTAQEMLKERHVVLLEIEDPFRSRVIDWRWDTPNVYSFTARLAAAVATQVARYGADEKLGAGWRTPAEALQCMSEAQIARVRRDCILEDREAESCPSSG